MDDPAEAAAGHLPSILISQAEAALDADREDDAARTLARPELAYCTDPAVAARRHVVAARIAVRVGSLQDAERESEMGLAAALRAGDPLMLAVVRSTYGRVLQIMGRHERALANMEASIPVLEAGDDARERFYGLNALGITLCELGLTEDGRRWFGRARDAAARAGLVPLEGTAAVNQVTCSVGIGAEREEQGDPEGARAAWEEGLRAADALVAYLESQPEQSPRNVICARMSRAECLERLGRHDDALEGFLAVERGHGAPFPVDLQFELDRNIARILMRRGDLDAAAAKVEGGVARAEALGTRAIMTSLYRLAAEIAERRGDLARALDLFRRYHALTDTTIDGPQRRAQVLTARLDTDRTVAEAEAQRVIAQELTQATRDLRTRATHLEEAASTDALTGLANRRHLDRVLADAHTAAMLNATPLCIAMVDIDRFKSVNDRHSHGVGDAVLCRIAGIIRDHCRHEDLAARHGGEEFAVILRDLDIHAAAAVCERLRAAVEAADWDQTAPGLSVTVSVGVCDATTFLDAGAGLQQADILLYEAKAGGRNLVVSGPR